MDRCYKVYMHTNLINWKRYIGLTRQKPEKRWRTYKAKTPIGAAFKKYGRENFKSEVLIDGLTKEDAERIEIYLIALFRSLTTQWGYNVEKGGSARGKVSDETKEKIRRSQHNRGVQDYEVMKAMSNTPEAKRKKSESLRATYQDPALKARLSAGLVQRWLNDEYKEKMGKVLSERNANNVPVVCDGITYRSIAHFADMHDLDASVVVSWLSGSRTMPDEWYDRGLCVTVGEDKRIKRSDGGNFDFTVDGIHFTKQSDLSRYLDIGSSTLSRYINGKRKCPQYLLDRGLVPIFHKKVEAICVSM